jgi:hypothetical protein
MDELQPGLSATPVILTIELDINAVAAGAQPPKPGSPLQAERLASQIAGDLRRILGEDLSEYGLIVVGAFYDLTELLRPGLPFIETLLELYRGSLPQGRFRPQVVAIGSEGEHFSVPSMAPARRPGSGPLLGVPILFVAPGPAIDALQTRLEALLLEKGTADVGTEQCLRQDFGLDPVNISYATVNDLCALLKVQLEHNQLDGLWQLLESALYRPGEKLRVQLPAGNLFFLNAGRVYSPFFTYSQWTGCYGTADAAARYVQWTKHQRQYMAGLAAHGLSTHWAAGDCEFTELCANRGGERAEQRLLPNQELVGEAPPTAAELAGASIVLLTEQAMPEVGAIAYTALVQAATGEILHLGSEYPLRPQAIVAIRDRWFALAAQLGVEAHLARPGRLVISENGEQLLPDFDLLGDNP